MSRRTLRTLVSLIVSLALVGAALWLREGGPGPGDGSAPGWRGPAAPAASGRWERLEGARLAEDPGNDGDSFLLRHAGGAHVVRLYFVDCPEKRRNRFNRSRLADQGAYFGGMTESETLEVGREAREFTLGLLGRAPIEVFTRWDPVFDERRHYAHLAVRLPDGSRRWLAELLVEQGLARIFTRGAALPDGTPEQPFAHRLRTLEKSARLARRGGWRRSERGPD